jgi:agmatine/peptidylarginine deiminase
MKKRRKTVMINNRKIIWLRERIDQEETIAVADETDDWLSKGVISTDEEEEEDRND